MPKGPQGQERPADVIGDAIHIARIVKGEVEETTLKQPAKHKSGSAEAKARAGKLAVEECSEIAHKTANARWM